MAKAKRTRPRQEAKISPEDAVRFLEDMRKMVSEFDEPATAISLRVPANILRAVKARAKSDGKKYQSMIVEFVRRGLRSNWG